MSSPAGVTSTPANLLASARAYHAPRTGAFGESDTMAAGRAAPSVPEVASQVRGSKVAWTRISTGESSSAPQIAAARWKAIRRCCPTVVPVLPPTGVAGVASLKPSVGPSALTIVIWASGLAGAAARKSAARRVGKGRRRGCATVTSPLRRAPVAA